MFFSVLLRWENKEELGHTEDLLGKGVQEQQRQVGPRVVPHPNLRAAEPTSPFPWSLRWVPL